MKFKIGILQGRLSKSPKGRLQYFPQNCEKEFILAKKLGLDYIEFFSERKKNIKNPIWDIKKLEQMKKEYLKLDLNFYSFVDDFILKKKIDTNLIKYYNLLLSRLKFLNIKILTIPFYGVNKISDNNFKKIVYFLNKITKVSKKKNIKIGIESNISFKKFCELKKNINNEIFFTFDTGNRVMLKRDLYNDLLLFKNHILHIHIKDKNSQGKNVLLGKGNVNFKKVFLALKKISYKNKLTLETNRLEHPMTTAKKNIKFLKKFFFWREKCFSFFKLFFIIKVSIVILSYIAINFIAM